MEIIEFFIWKSVSFKIIGDSLNGIISLLNMDNWFNIMKKLWRNEYFHVILSRYLYEILILSRSNDWMKIIELLWDRDDFTSLLSDYSEMNKVYNEVIEKQKKISNIEIDF